MKRIVWKFFGAFAFLTFIAVLVLNFFVSLSLQQEFEQKISEELKSNAVLVGDILKEALAGGEGAIIQARVDDILKQRYGINHATLQLECQDCVPNHLYCDIASNTRQHELL